MLVQELIATNTTLWVFCSVHFVDHREERSQLLKGSGVTEAVDKDLTNIEKEFNTTVLPFVKKYEDKFRYFCVYLIIDLIWRSFICYASSHIELDVYTGFLIQDATI